MNNPNVYQLVNHDDITAISRKRWFPPELSLWDISNQNTRNTNYAALLATYNTALATYNAAIIPSVPTPEEAIVGTLKKYFTI